MEKSIYTIPGALLHCSVRVCYYLELITLILGIILYLQKQAE